METTDSKSFFKRDKIDQDTFLVMEDNSLVYKLRRSCDKVHV